MTDRKELLMSLFANVAFITEIKEVEDFSTLFNAVQARIPEVTEEDLKAFTAELAVEVKSFMEQHESEEFTEEDLVAVTGGVALLTVAVVGAMWAVGGYVGWKVGRYLFG